MARRVLCLGYQDTGFEAGSLHGSECLKGPLSGPWLSENAARRTNDRFGEAAPRRGKQVPRSAMGRVQLVATSSQIQRSTLLQLRLELIAGSASSVAGVCIGVELAESCLKY